VERSRRAWAVLRARQKRALRNRARAQCAITRGRNAQSRAGAMRNPAQAQCANARRRNARARESAMRAREKAHWAFSKKRIARPDQFSDAGGAARCLL